MSNAKDQQGSLVVSSTMPVGGQHHPGMADAPGMAATIDGLPRRFEGYEIIRLLDRGSFGRVYLARDLLLEREVAIKFLRNDTLDTEGLLSEARVAASLQHPNIASLYTAGRVVGRNFIVSEYVRGSNLDSITSPLPWTEVLDIGLPLASGVAALHRNHVLHRDIKPGNVVMSDGPTPEPKLVDFGLAEVMEVTDLTDLTDIREVAAAADARQQAAGPRHYAGTPHYMAPEIWLHEPATPRTDVYALGVLLYKLCAGHVPHFRAQTQEQLKRMVKEQDASPLVTVAPDTDPRFAAIVDRCLARDPASRIESADALRDELERLQWVRHSRRWSQVSLPEGCPYPGLAAFDTEQRALFFGRETESRQIIERLRTQRLVLVAGESGVGKSSLVRAGVLPQITEIGFNDGRTWSIHTIRPEGRTMASLARALAQQDDATVFLKDMMTSFMAPSQRLRAQHGKDRGTLLYFEQIEDLLALESPEDAERVGQILAALVEHTPGVKVLATVRTNKVSALANLAGLGRLVERALYILRPLDEGAVKNAIVGPVEVKGVRFESDDMVATLAAAAKGGMGLLQFALRELWDRRDVDDNLIREHALRQFGGVEGALFRHADTVMLSLSDDKRRAADDILMRLVTVSGSRASCSEHYVTDGDEIRRQVLEVLVRGRLVATAQVRGEVSYQIGHEALITGWSRLRHLLGKEGGLQAVKERLAGDAEEWRRRGRPRDLLWPSERLREAEPLDIQALPAPDAEFLGASGRQRQRNRLVRRLTMVAPFLLIAATYGVFWYVQSVERGRAVDRFLDESRAYSVKATDLQATFAAEHARALQYFGDWAVDDGERAWATAMELIPAIDNAYTRAGGPLEAAFRRDPRRDDVRTALARLLHQRVGFAQATGRQHEQDDLLLRLAEYDNDLADEWRRPVRVALTTEPPGLPVTLQRYQEEGDGSFSLETVDTGGIGEIALEPRAQTPTQWSLEPGSYLLVLASNGRTVAQRYPFRVQGGFSTDNRTTRALHIDVPEQSQVPPGFVYVPEGVFLAGYGGDRAIDPVRDWYTAMPLHERRTGPYLIARHETTYADWIDFLEHLPADRQAAHLPEARDETFDKAAIALRRVDDTFEFTFSTIRYAASATSGQPFVYGNRDRRATQDWLRFPVTAISLEDVDAYVEWLRTRPDAPIRGARLCYEDEWERAVRGADGRLYAHGNHLEPDDANYDKTYDKDRGFDEVGSHPASESPFGLLDAIGNAREMTLPRYGTEAPLVVRSAAYWWDRSSNAAVNREDMSAGQRTPHIGLRVCADWPTR